MNPSFPSVTARVDQAFPAPRRGSVLVIVMGILIALLLFGGWFLRYMLMQTKAGHKQGEIRVTTAASHALAVLGAQKLVQEVFKNPNHDLTKLLCLRLDKLTDVPRSPATRIPLESGAGNLSGVVDELRTPLQSLLGNFTYDVNYAIRAADFTNLAGTQAPVAYPREKVGLIHVYVSTRHRKINSSSDVAEDYHFAFRVKVVSALVPLLSKFTMYIEDAHDGGPTGAEAPWRFNTISSDQHGNLPTNPSARPIVLYNGADAAGSSVPTRFEDLVKAQRGLVYLGGGKNYLNLARGWTTPGQFSEGFHLFAAGSGDGLYTINWVGDTAVMNWDQGVSDEMAGAGAQDWWDFIKYSPNADHAKKSSLLRLFGTDSRKSPTLVLGEVYRSFICARAFKSTASPARFRAGFLVYMPDQPTYAQYISPNPPDEFDSIATFASFVGLSAGNYVTYNGVFASNLAYTPYNLSLAFMATNNRVAFPLPTLPTDPLIDLMRTNPMPDPDTMHAIPDPFRILEGVSNLKNMSALMKGLQVPGVRTSWVVNPPSGGNVADSLKQKNLLNDRDLDLNGWVYSPGSQNLEITSNMKVKSNGGIVLKKGNIVIRGEIDAENGAKTNVLQLVTLDGDIIIDCNQKVQAAFVAPKGKVIIGTGGRPKIRGAMAMSRFDITSASQGADLEYNSDLAALPNQTDDGGSEKALLAISLDASPLVLQ